MTDGIVKIVGVPSTRGRTFEQQANPKKPEKPCPDADDFTYEIEEGCSNESEEES